MHHHSNGTTHAHTPAPPPSHSHHPLNAAPQIPNAIHSRARQLIQTINSNNQFKQSTQTINSNNNARRRCSKGAVAAADTSSLLSRVSLYVPVCALTLGLQSVCARACVSASIITNCMYRMYRTYRTHVAHAAMYKSLNSIPPSPPAHCPAHRRQ